MNFIYNSDYLRQRLLLEDAREEGIEEGIQQGIQQQKELTEQERKRADAAEAEVERLKKLLEKKES